MSFLSEYLERRRAAQEADDAEKQLEAQSPEELLESLRSNTEHTSDLLGETQSQARQQNKSVLDSLDVIADNVGDGDHAVSVSVDHAADVVQLGTKLTNQTLIDINETLKGLAATNRLIEKHLRPVLNSKDDTYQTKKDIAAAVVKDKKKDEKKDETKPEDSGPGALLAGSLFDIFGGEKTDPKTGKPVPSTGAPAGKAGIFSRAKSVLGSIGTKSLEVAKSVFRSPLGKVAISAGALASASGAVDAASETMHANNAKAAEVVKEAPRSKLAETSYKVGETAGKFAARVKEISAPWIEKASEVSKSVAERAQPSVEKLKEAAKPSVEKIREVFKPVVDKVQPLASKVAENASKAAEAIKPAAANAIESAKPWVAKAADVAEKVTDKTSAAASRGATWIKEAGTDLIGKAKTALTATPATTAVGDVGKSAVAAAEVVAEKPSLWGRAGSLLGKIATPLAVGMSGYEAYQTEQDDSLTRDQKNVKHSGTVGGLAGATAGAAVGASVGSVVPVVGTAIGGIVGGIGGYFGGEKLGETVMTGVQGLNSVMPDRMKDAIGASVALAISPFSQEARDSLKNNLVPEINQTGNKLAESVSSFQKSSEDLSKTFLTSIADFTKSLSDTWDSTKDNAKSVWAGVKVAASSTGNAVSDLSKSVTQKVKEGYKEGGVMGALKSGATSVRQEGSRIAADWAKDMSVSKGIAVGRFNEAERTALNTAQQAGEKFRGGKGLTQETKDMITRVAAEKGIDPKHLLAMTQMESGGNANAVSSTGAAGLMQFTSGTAKEMGLNNRFDPEANVRAGADLYLKNKQHLESKGEAATLDNLYLAHQQGAGGAVSLLKASRGEGQLSDTVRKNMSVNVGKDAGGSSDAEVAKNFLSANKKALASASDKADKTTVADGTYAKTTLAKTEVARADASKTEPTKVAATAMATKPEAGKPEAVKTEVAKVAVAKTGTAQPEVPKTTEVKPSTAKSSATKPEVAQIAAKTEAKSAGSPGVSKGADKPAVTELAALGEEPSTDVTLLKSEVSSEIEAPAVPKFAEAVIAPPTVQYSPAISKPTSTQPAYGGVGQAPSYASLSLPQAKALAASYSSLPSSPALQELAARPDVSKLAAAGDVASLANMPEVQAAAASLRQSGQGLNLSSLASSVMSTSGVRASAPSFSGSYTQIASKAVDDVSMRKTPGTPAFTPKYSTLAMSAAPELTPFEAYSAAPTVKTVKQSAPSRVAANVPEEVRSVEVTNPSDFGLGTQSGPAPTTTTAAFDTAVPRLDNIPLQVTDLGLVLLNIGHI